MSQARPEAQLGRRVALALVTGLLIYAALALWADLDGLGAAIRSVPLWAPLAACGLSLLNYGVRFPRWQRYLTLTGSEVRGWTSLRIYLAGLSLTVSPGKVGEAMKSWLLKDADGTPLARSAPIVLAERITDLAGFLVLIAITSSTADHLWITALTAGLGVLVLSLVVSKTVAHMAIGLVAKLPAPFGPKAERLEETLDSARRLLAPRELPFATALATLGWFLECVGCWLIVTSVLPEGMPVPDELGILAVTYAFALAAVAGALVVIAPGGLGVTEGLLAGLLQGGYQAAGFSLAAARSKALACTLVTRLCTLWFAMGIGLVALWLHRRLRKRVPGRRLAES